jgi:hypothetical protein
MDTTADTKIRILFIEKLVNTSLNHTVDERSPLFRHLPSDSTTRHPLGDSDYKPEIMARLSPRSVRPNALVDSFLGLLDIKSGE